MVEARRHVGGKSFARDPLIFHLELVPVLEAGDLPLLLLAGERHLTPEVLWIDLGLEPIDASVRTFFESWCNQSFANVQVYSNWFSHLLTRPGNAPAITFGDRIFFSKAGWQQYQAIHQLASSREDALAGMNTVGHELAHTLQARDNGLLVFLANYLYQWARVGFDYRTNPYEVEAYANGQRVEDFLTDNPLYS